jgi:hypothetical protein
LAGGGWGYTYDGYDYVDCDAISPVLMALAKYYTAESSSAAGISSELYADVKNAVDNSISLINSFQGTSGAISSYGTDNAFSTGLIISGLAAIGQNPDEFIVNDNSLVDGLLSLSNETFDGFLSQNWTTFTWETDAMATEQGFRGLISAMEFMSTGTPYNVYDFSGNASDQGIATEAAYVTFSTVPSDATVAVTSSGGALQTQLVPGVYDLAADTYNYTVSKSGYASKTGSFVVTDLDDSGSRARTINVSLSSLPSSGDEVSNVTVYFTLIGDSDHDDSTIHVYAEDPSAMETWISRRTITVPVGSSAFDVFDAALGNAGIQYTEVSDSYISVINGLSEYDNGPNSGWLYEVNGESATVGCRDYVVSAGDKIVFHYTDDYSQETGSAQWSGDATNSGAAPDLQPTAGAITSAGISTTAGISTAGIRYDEDAGLIGAIDVNEGDWFYGAVVFAVKNGLFNGTTATTFSPNAAMTRGMFATVLWRLAGAPASTAPSPTRFSDVKSGQWYTEAVSWADENGLLTGYGNGEFGAANNITREEIAAVLFRCADYFNTNAVTETAITSGALVPGTKADLAPFTDAASISGWADEAMRWAVANGLLNGRTATILAPGANSSRAEVAAILQRFIEGTGEVPIQGSDPASAALTDTTQVILTMSPDPQVGTSGGEWAVLGLARSKANVTDTYYDTYLANVEAYVKAHSGVLSERKYTEYSRVILALTAIGADPSDIAGYDLLTPLGDFEKTVLQGIGGPVWALIALDSGNYQIPENSGALTQATREMYVEYILSKQLADGGFSLSGSRSDPDTTAMVLYALADYRGSSDVEQAVRKAISCLSVNQDPDGGYSSWGNASSESVSQVIIALCKLGISIEDPRFMKNDKTLTDNLLSYYRPGKGFLHTSDSGTCSQISTEQAFLALTALQRASGGLDSLYDIKDVKL